MTCRLCCDRIGQIMGAGEEFSVLYVVMTGE